MCFFTKLFNLVIFLFSYNFKAIVKILQNFKKVQKVMIGMSNLSLPSLGRYHMCCSIKS